MGTMQTGGRISMYEIRAAHGGGTGPISMGDLYKDGPKVIKFAGEDFTSNVFKVYQGNTDNTLRHSWGAGRDYQQFNRKLSFHIGVHPNNDRWDFGNTDMRFHERDHGRLQTRNSPPVDGDNGYDNSNKILSITLYDTDLVEIGQDRIQTNSWSPFESSENADYPFTGSNGVESRMIINTMKGGPDGDYSQISFDRIYSTKGGLTVARNIGKVEMVYVDHIDAWNLSNRTELWHVGKASWTRKGGVLSSSSNTDYYDFDFRIQTAVNEDIPASGEFSMDSFYSSKYVTFPGEVSYTSPATTTPGVYHIGARPSGVSGGSVVGSTPDNRNAMSVTVGTMDVPPVEQAYNSTFGPYALYWAGGYNGGSPTPTWSSLGSWQGPFPAVGPVTNLTMNGGVNAGGYITERAVEANDMTEGLVYQLRMNNTTGGATEYSFTDSAGNNFVMRQGTYVRWTGAFASYQIEIGDGSQQPAVWISNRGGTYLEGGEFSLSTGGETTRIPNQKFHLTGSWAASVTKDPYPA
tara:strand:- start:25 stop:1584 length:1560 start_codon:yes stop_codon:yes gene_type:complete